MSSYSDDHDSVDEGEGQWDVLGRFSDNKHAYTAIIYTISE